MENLLEVVRAVVAHARGAVDADRVYVTGLSMGGFGTWSLVMTSPGTFAAAVPVCGGFAPALNRRLWRGTAAPPTDEWRDALAALPGWAFHGEHDDVVTVDATHTAVAKVREATGGRATVRVTVYPHPGRCGSHDSWTETYENPETYRWMLSCTRRAPSGAPKPFPP
jgi:predicted peptidase